MAARSVGRPGCGVSGTRDFKVEPGAFSFVRISSSPPIFGFKVSVNQTRTSIDLRMSSGNRIVRRQRRRPTHIPSVVLVLGRPRWAVGRGPGGCCRGLAGNRYAARRDGPWTGGVPPCFQGLGCGQPGTGVVLEEPNRQPLLLQAQAQIRPVKLGVSPRAGVALKDAGGELVEGQTESAGQSRRPTYPRASRTSEPWRRRPLAR